MTKKRMIFLVIKSFLVALIVLLYEFKIIAPHKVIDTIAIILLVFITYDLVVWARAIKLARNQE
jgi:hypothetical protein